MDIVNFSTCEIARVAEDESVRAEESELPIVGGNMDIRSIREECRGKHRYALLKIGFFGKSNYGICVLGEDYSFETLGEERKSAEEFFASAVKNQIFPCHLYDMISDFRREKME